MNKKIEYKVGDVVVINHRTHDDHDYPYFFTDIMARQEGVKCVIVDKNESSSWGTLSTRRLYNGDNHYYKLAPMDKEYYDKDTIISSNWHSTMFSLYKSIEDRKEKEIYLLDHVGEVIKSRNNRWYFKPVNGCFWTNFNDTIIEVFGTISQLELTRRLTYILEEIECDDRLIRTLHCSGGHKSLPTFDSEEDCRRFIDTMNSAFKNLEDFRHRIEGMYYGGDSRVENIIPYEKEKDRGAENDEKSKRGVKESEKNAENVKKTEKSFNIKEIGSNMESVFSRTISNRREDSRELISKLLSLKL